MELHLSSATLQLHNDLVYPWYTGDRCFVRGYAFAGETLLQGNSFLAYMSNCTSIEEVEIKLRQLNGFYNVILQMDDALIACVDLVSSMPLFFTESIHPVITDGVGGSLLEKSIPDKDLLEIFRHSLFVPGDRTLLKGVFQILPGSYAVLQNGSVYQISYFQKSYAFGQITELSQAVSALDSAYLGTFQRTVQMLNGRTAVIPLSGGHDSRLIAFYLKRLGYDNIISYTYGLAKNQESIISKQVADALQIPWYFVEYDSAGMREVFRKHYDEFAVLSGNATAVPCLQEWYAVYQLKKQGVLDENCVIIPGYSGDFLAGTHLLRDVQKMHPITAEKLKHIVCAHHFRERPFCELSTRSRLDALLDDALPVLKDSDKLFTEDEANLLYEQFDWQNRQAFFIENAVRVYDFWGIPWLTPMFERSQFDVWGRIHNSLRYDRKAFFAMEDTVYPETLKAVGYATSSTIALPRWGLLRKLVLLLRGATVLHPLYGHFPMGLNYLRDLLNHRLRGVNMYAQDYYLEILETYWIKKEQSDDEKDSL